MLEISLDLLFTFDRTIYLPVRNLTFLCGAVREHHNRLAPEGIQHTVVNPLVAGAQFVDSVSQVVRLWPVQFVPQLCKAADPLRALDLYFLWQRIEPSNQWDRTVLVFVKTDFSVCRRSLLCSHY